MEWVLKSPQSHSTFSQLGFMNAGVYYINENVNDVLQYILHNIRTEDKFLLSYRRSIAFGQNIQKDLIPLLIHTKEDTTIGLLVSILANLSTPAECLLSVEITSQSDVGRHTVFEINNLLSSTKSAFTGHRATKVVVEFLKKNVDINEQKITPEQGTNICNSLLLLRNVLHEPEAETSPGPGNSGSGHAVQNQILWNMFNQSFDKIFIKLMTIPEAANWGVTMVQLVALLYNDQHVAKLQKSLNTWLTETTVSESSEDDESNTSQPGRGSANSSPISTSQPTSDSSDTGGGAKWGATSDNNTVQDQPSPPRPLPDKNDVHLADNDVNDIHKADNDVKSDSDEKMTKLQPITTTYQQPAKTFAREYGMSIGNQELISTSSNDDDVPSERPVHKKPHNLKQRANTRARTVLILQEQKRKKIAKRGKANKLENSIRYFNINVQGLTNKTPTDDDILNIVKKFTVDFLLNGYNSIVQTLHSQILTNLQLQFDTTHFFWLVSYFLKFAVQIEVDLGQISSVISFDLVSFLAAEGVNLCEQFELAVKLDGNDLEPSSSRRLHLVVTSIREIVKFIDLYKKSSHISDDDKKILTTLEIRICETNELRSLLVLLLRLYNPKYHSKQYLQDLIVTNHILLTFTDSAMRSPDYTGSTNMADHIKQFATPEIMCQYGLLLEDYAVNGEYINDCIFTIMHHVGGQPDSLKCLSQPTILKTFTSLREADFEISDDWSDLVQYVKNTFMEKPKLNIANFRLAKEIFGDVMTEHPGVARAQGESHPASKTESKKSAQSSGSDFSSMKRPYYSTQINEEISDVKIAKLCEQLRQDGKFKCLDWIQEVLLETCYAKLQVEKMYNKGIGTPTGLSENSQFKLLSQEMDGSPVMSPVTYHALLLNRSVPLVPWNGEQASMCKDFKFLKLLLKLGFQMPVDTGKVFMRIPHVWSADNLYEVASRVGAIDQKKLKFSASEITNRTKTPKPGIVAATAYLAEDVTAVISGPDNFYQIHIQKHFAAVVNFTPRPGSSFNSDVDNETNKRGWLEIVQQSKKLKLTCNAGRVHERPATAMAVAPALAPVLRARTPSDDSSLLTEQLEELEDIDSVSETASVASDLPHMYVSDEEEHASDAERGPKRPRLYAPPH